MLTAIFYQLSLLAIDLHSWQGQGKQGGAGSDKSDRWLRAVTLEDSNTMAVPHRQYPIGECIANGCTQCGADSHVTHVAHVTHDVGDGQQRDLACRGFLPCLLLSLLMQVLTCQMTTEQS
jgi:hypothetical protein